jgi:hypothetical protein
MKECIMRTLSRWSLEIIAAVALVILFDSAGRWVKRWREPRPF